MKYSHKLVLTVMTSIIVLCTVAIFLIVLISARRIYARETFSNEDAIRIGLDKGFIDQELLNLPWEDFQIGSPHGYVIAGSYMPGTTDNTILFSHGLTHSRWSMLKYAPVFINSGWNIVLMDHRKHGQSGGETISYGVFEKADMGIVVEEAFQCFPDTQLFGLYGESMGAAIALQYAPGDSRVSFVISDCSFDNLHSELRYRAREIPLPDFLRNVILKLVIHSVRFLADYDINSIRPDIDILETGIPILLVHGEADDYVPTVHSRRMYEARKDIAPTELFLYSESRHAQSIQDHREDYERRLIVWFQKHFGVNLDRMNHD